MPPFPTNAHRPNQRGVRFWVWLVVASVCLGAIASSLALPGSDNINKLAWPHLLLMTFIWSGIFLILFLTAIFSKLLQRFVRWLFGWRTIKRCMIAFALLAVLAAMVHVEENWRGKRAWEKYKRGQEAKGEYFDFKSFVPAPVPDDQNFALTPIVASCYTGRWQDWRSDDGPANTNLPVNRLDMGIYRSNLSWTTNLGINLWREAKKVNLEAWQSHYRATAMTNVWDDGSGTNQIEIKPLEANEFPIAPLPQSPAADVLFALGKYDSAIEELRQASLLPHSRFPLRYEMENPNNIPLPHLQSLKSCVPVLTLRAIAKLQLGQTEQALADVKLALRLVDSLRTEPFLISHHVRLAMWQFILQPVWEGLAERRWSDAQLAELNQELQKLDFLSDYQFCMRGERAVAIAVIDYIQRKRNLRESFVYPEPEEPTKSFFAMAFYLVPAGWFYQNGLALARMYENGNSPLIDAGQRAVPSGATTNLGENIAERELRHPSPYNALARMLYHASTRAAMKFALEQTYADFARIACALERYRLAHGEYPESLDALVPQLIEKLPLDIIHGQPLHYRRTDDGKFVLYSIGWNEKDDGGEVALNKSGRMIDARNGDWVWKN